MGLMRPHHHGFLGFAGVVHPSSSHGGPPLDGGGYSPLKIMGLMGGGTFDGFLNAPRAGKKNKIGHNSLPIGLSGDEKEVRHTDF